MKLTPEQRALVERWMRMALTKASMTEKRYRLEPGELVADAYSALCRAAAGFKPQLGYQFSTYAYLAVQRSLDRAAYRAEGERIGHQRLPPRLRAARKHDGMEAAEFLEGLTRRERRVVKILLAGGTVREVRARLKIRHDAAETLLDAIRDKARGAGLCEGMDDDPDAV